VEVVVVEVKALDQEVGQAMEVEVEAEAVVARVGMEVEEEEEKEEVGVEEEELALALAQVMEAGLVMALDMEEGKVIKSLP
jgi:uncharacterized protein YqfA (UPF0365 family)